jgi:hypothetical protein
VHHGGASDEGQISKRYGAFGEIGENPDAAMSAEELRVR